MAHVEEQNYNFAFCCRIQLPSYTAADEVCPLQMKYKWGPHKRITFEASRVQPLVKYIKGCVLVGASCFACKRDLKWNMNRGGRAE